MLTNLLYSATLNAGLELRLIPFWNNLITGAIGWINMLKEAILTNWQWGLNIVLLIGTIVISSKTYVSQVRASVREALEQLKAWDLGTDGFLQIILHDMNYFHSETTVAIKFYRGGRHDTHGASSYRPIGDLFFRWNRRKSGENVISVGQVYDNLMSIPEVSKVNFRHNEIQVTIQSADSVNVRKIAESALRETWNTYKENR